MIKKFSEFQSLFESIDISNEDIYKDYKQPLDLYLKDYLKEKLCVWIFKEYNSDIGTKQVVEQILKNSDGLIHATIDLIKTGSTTNRGLNGFLSTFLKNMPIAGLAITALGGIFLLRNKLGNLIKRYRITADKKWTTIDNLKSSGLDVKNRTPDWQYWGRMDSKGNKIFTRDLPDGNEIVRDYKDTWVINTSNNNLSKTTDGYIVKKNIVSDDGIVIAKKGKQFLYKDFEVNPDRSHIFIKSEELAQEAIKKDLMFDAKKMIEDKSVWELTLVDYFGVKNLVNTKIPTVSKVLFGVGFATTGIGSVFSLIYSNLPQIWEKIGENMYSTEVGDVQDFLEKEAELKSLFKEKLVNSTGFEADLDLDVNQIKMIQNKISDIASKMQEPDKNKYIRFLLSSFNNDAKKIGWVVVDILSQARIALIKSSLAAYIHTSPMHHLSEDYIENK